VYEPRSARAEAGLSTVRNWAVGSATAGLVLLSPIVAFLVFIATEMAIDLVMDAGATVIWPAVAGAMAWVLLRKFGGQTSRLRSEGA
jgi:hypothetical protein